MSKDPEETRSSEQTLHFEKEFINKLLDSNVKSCLSNWNKESSFLYYISLHSHTQVEFSNIQYIDKLNQSGYIFSMDGKIKSQEEDQYEML